MRPSAIEEDCDIYVPGDGLMHGNVEDDIELMVRWPIKRFHAFICVRPCEGTAPCRTSMNSILANLCEAGGC
jgi:hypothetical protein